MAISYEDVVRLSYGGKGTINHKAMKRAAVLIRASTG